ncbi:UNVERIFIED_CONTAM: hypothetical protein FKN15_072650 [Acipenser sinensis]
MYCKVNSMISVGHGLLVELFITFELVFTVFVTCDSKRQDLKGSAALAISFAVTIGHLFAVNSMISVGHGLLVELFITFELVFTVFVTCDSKRQDLKGSAALAISFAVTIGHLFAGNHMNTYCYVIRALPC